MLPAVRSAGRVALDTEANSLYAYPEQLCLIQLAVRDEDWLIDPLSELDLGPLWRAVGNRELVFHAADYDMRLLRRTYGFRPKRLFDTLIAARLLGHRQFGLHHLLEHFLDVHLDKGPQKADWARRPLSPRMEQYARNDARYLLPLVERLEAELKEAGREDWHRQSCERLMEVCSEDEPTDHERVWRIKGSDRLPPRGKAVLRELWHWREGEARRANRPPYFVVSHPDLVQVAEVAAQGGGRSLEWPRGLTTRRKREMGEAIQRALALPEERWPRRLRSNGRRPTHAEVTRSERLKAVRDRRAEELGIDPTLIASRATLMQIAMANGDVPDVLPWQRDLLGL